MALILNKTITSVITPAVRGVIEPAITGITQEEISNVVIESIYIPGISAITGITQEGITGITQEAILEVNEPEVIEIIQEQLTGITQEAIIGIIEPEVTGLTNTNYTDKYGNVHSTPYMIIDKFIFDKKNKNVEIVIDIYKNTTSRNKQCTPFLTDIMVIYNNDRLFDDYFTMEENDNIYKYLYNFVQITKYTNWMSDES